MKLVAPGLHGVHGVLHRAVGRDHDDRQLGIALANVAQHLDAIAFRQCKIQQHQVERTISQARQALVAVVRRFHLVAFQIEQGLQRLANGGLIVNDQD